MATRRNVRSTGPALDGVVLPPSQRAAASAGAGDRGAAAGARRRTNRCSCRRGERGGGRKPAEEPIRRSRASRRSAGEGVKASASGPARTLEGQQHPDHNTQLRSIDEQVAQRRADRTGRQRRRTEEGAAPPTARPRAAGNRWSYRKHSDATALRDMAHLTLQVVHRSTISEYCRQCLIKGKPSRPVVQVTR